MKEVLRTIDETPEKNIYMYYAIGKELEDLEQWEQSFEYYKKAGDAVTSVAKYDVAADIALIDTIIEVCDAEWLASGAGRPNADDAGKDTDIYSRSSAYRYDIDRTNCFQSFGGGKRR